MKLIIIFFVFWCSNVFAATDYTADTNTKAAYKMNETSGTLTDASGHSNTCTAIGTPGTYNLSGKYGGAFDFTETNNTGFDCGAGASINDLTSITLAAWEGPDTDGDNNDSSHAGVIIWKSDGDNNGWGFANRTTGELMFLQKWDGGAGRWRTDDSVVVYDGSLQHVAVTYDGSSTSNDPIFYVNGVAVTTTEVNTPAGSRQSDASYNMLMGLESTTTNVGELDARLDEVLVYNGILNSTQINEVMNNGLDGAQGVTTLTGKMFALF